MFQDLPDGRMDEARDISRERATIVQFRAQLLSLTCLNLAEWSSFALAQLLFLHLD